MSAIIYETVNHFNKDRGILPYRYIGSDQYDRSEYLGSSKKLREDINRLGKEYFSKRVICRFEINTPNIVVRSVESRIQTYYNAAKDPTYYNKTNRSHRGYNETEEEKNHRMSKLATKRKSWWDTLTEAERVRSKEISGKNLRDYNIKMKGKSYEEIYGEVKALEKKQKHSGGNNGKAKNVIHLESGKCFGSVIDAMKFFNIRQYSTFHNRVKKGEFKLSE